MNPDQPLQPSKGNADIYPEAHLVSPTTLLALRKLAHHENRRKHKRRGLAKHPSKQK